MSSISGWQSFKRYHKLQFFSSSYASTYTHNKILLIIGQFSNIHVQSDTNCLGKYMYM